MVIATENQYNLAMRFEKGTVLMFTAPRITYVRQTDRDAAEQSINIYAEVENFKIVAGMDMAPASRPLPPEEEAPAPARRPAPPARAVASQPDAADIGDPFDEALAPAPPAPKRPVSQSTPVRPPREASRRPAPPPADDDLSVLDDPFAE